MGSQKFSNFFLVYLKGSKNVIFFFVSISSLEKRGFCGGLRAAFQCPRKLEGDPASGAAVTGQGGTGSDWKR